MLIDVKVLSWKVSDWPPNPSIQFFQPLSRPFIGIDSVWDMFCRLQIQLHQKVMYLHPLFWWQLGSFLNIPAIIRTMLFLSSDCRIDGSKSGLPYTKQLHKSSVAHWIPIILDMPHSPTGSVLAFEHPKDLGRQVAILEVQRLLMNKDVEIWAGTPTYSSFSSFVIFASSFRVSSHLSHLVIEVLIGAKQSPLQPHFELIKFLNLTGFTVCKSASCKAFWCFTTPGLLALFAGGKRCNISLVITEPFNRHQHWNLARGTEGSLEVGVEGSFELGSLTLEVEFWFQFTLDFVWHRVAEEHTLYASRTSSIMLPMRKLHRGAEFTLQRFQWHQELLMPGKHLTWISLGQQNLCGLLTDRSCGGLSLKIVRTAIIVCSFYPYPPRLPKRA